MALPTSKHFADFAEEAAKHMEHVMGRSTPFSEIKEMICSTPHSRDTRFALGGVLPAIHRVPFEHERPHMLDAMRYALQPFPSLVMQINDCDKETLKMLLKGAKKSMCEQKDSVEHRNWEYEVAHPDTICPDEIYKYVSRTNPVVIAKIGVKVVTYLVQDENGKPVVHDVKPTDDIKFKEQVRVEYDTQHLVFVHGSLVHKAKALGIALPEYIQTTTQAEVYGDTTGDSVEMITAWAREVKSAKWGKKADRKSVRVIIPRI